MDVKHINKKYKHLYQAWPGALLRLGTHTGSVERYCDRTAAGQWLSELCVQYISYLNQKCLWPCHKANSICSWSVHWLQLWMVLLLWVCKFWILWEHFKNYSFYRPYKYCEILLKTFSKYNSVTEMQESMNICSQHTFIVETIEMLHK